MTWSEEKERKGEKRRRGKGRRKVGFRGREIGRKRERRGRWR